MTYAFFKCLNKVCRFRLEIENYLRYLGYKFDRVEEMNEILDVDKTKMSCSLRYCELLKKKHFESRLTSKPQTSIRSNDKFYSNANLKNKSFFLKRKKGSQK